MKRELRLVHGTKDTESPLINTNPKKTSWLVLVALISIQLCFGVNYLFSKLVLAQMPPLLWASVRALGTALVLAIFASLTGKLNVARAIKYHRHFIAFSLLGIIINQACFLTGLSRTSPTNSALINTLIPIFTALIVTLRHRESMARDRWLGLTCAFFGVLVLQNFQSLGFSSETLLGDGLTLINALSYALFLSYSQRFFEKNDFIWSTTWLFIYGSIGLTLIALPQWMTFSFSSLSSELYLPALGGIFIGATIPYVLISFTLAKADSTLVALFVYLQAVIAGGLSWWILGEQMTPSKLIAFGLIFLGLFLAVSRKLSFINRKSPLSGV